MQGFGFFRLSPTKRRGCIEQLSEKARRDSKLKRCGPGEAGLVKVPTAAKAVHREG